MHGLNSGDFSLYTGDHAAQRKLAQHGGGPRAICYRGQWPQRIFVKLEIRCAIGQNYCMNVYCTSLFNLNLKI